MNMIKIKPIAENVEEKQKMKNTRGVNTNYGRNEADSNFGDIINDAIPL